MKPRGLMVVHQFRPLTNGAELQAERLAGRLVEMGHGMAVLTEHRAPGSPLEETINGVKVHRVSFRLAYQVMRGGGSPPSSGTW